jgi:hypothetical protein
MHTTNTAPAARLPRTTPAWVTAGLAKLAARRAAIFAPYAAIIADLIAAGAVVETYASPASDGATHWSQRCDFARVQVWIFDQKGRLHISATLDAYSGAPMRGSFVNASEGLGFRGYCELAALVAPARAARATRVN